MFACALSLGACAWGDGDPFAVLHAKLEAELAVPAERALPDGWQRLASGYELRLDELVIADAELELAGVGEAADEGEGDHGHDHGGGGAEAEAEAPEAVVIAHLPVPELDVVAGGASELACEPSCDLPRGQLSRLRLEIGAVGASGQVRDGRADASTPTAVAFAGEIAFDPPLVTSAELELAIERDGPREVELLVRLHPSAALFDELEWAALEGEPLGLTGPAASAAIGEAVAAGRLELAVELHGHADEHDEREHDEHDEHEPAERRAFAPAGSE